MKMEIVLILMQKQVILKDDSGAVVQTFWSDDLRIETQTVSSLMLHL